MFHTLLRSFFPDAASVMVPPGARNLLPKQVALSTPANGGSQASNAIALAWTAADRAVSYELQYADDDAFTVNAVLAAATSPAAPVLAEAVYYWRVRGVNSYGPGAWSTARSVTITAP